MIWLVLLLLAVLITLIIIAIVIYFQPPAEQTPPPTIPNNYLPVAGWQDNGTVGDCQGYQFPATREDNLLVPGTPTFKADTIEQLTPQDPFPCLDTDNLNAQRFEHTCTLLNNVTGQAGSCQGINGGLVPVGVTEQYFAGCLTQNNSETLYCPGQIAAVSVGITSPTTYPCLQKASDGSISAVSDCDLTKDDQIFRVIRTNPGQGVPVPSENPGGGVNGILAQIVDRTTGQCLVPASTPVTPGTRLTIGPCQPNFGLIWAMIPPTNFEIGRVSPQQIVYVGDADPDQLSSSVFSSTQNFLTFLRDNNGLSIRNLNGTIDLQPFVTTGFGIPGNPNLNYNSQYMSFPLYNLITNSDVFTPY